MKQDNEVILKKIYPLVEQAISRRVSQYKQYISKFIAARAEDLYAIAPYRRIYFTDNDRDEFFRMLGIQRSVIQRELRNTFYFSIPSFNPAAAKDETTIAMLCIVRYFLMNRKKYYKELDLSLVNIAFSGSFYPSIHYGSFQVVQPIEYKHVMDYVVNNKMSAKYDLKVKGNVFGAIRSIATTWAETYQDKFEDFDDEDIKDIVQQLHTRIKSFMKNIATLYYEAFENRNEYLNYASDDYSEDNYRLADTDSLMAERIIDKTVQAISTMGVNYSYCKMAADVNVSTDEIKAIIEWVLKNDTKSLTEVKEFISLLVYLFFQSTDKKDVKRVEFVRFTTAPRPNSKVKEVIRSKEILERWLMNGSRRYHVRKNRAATKASYQRSVLMYFALMIHFSNL